MTPGDWGASYARAVMLALSGDAGERVGPDDPFLLMLNAWWEPLQFAVPESLRNLSWQLEVDTADPGAVEVPIDSSAPVTLIGRSLKLLRAPR